MIVLSIKKNCTLSSLPVTGGLYVNVWYFVALKQLASDSAFKINIACNCAFSVHTELTLTFIFLTKYFPPLNLKIHKGV